MDSEISLGGDSGNLDESHLPIVVESISDNDENIVLPSEISSSWFADEFLETLLSLAGSYERDQIAIHLRRANRMRLDDDVACAVGETVLTCPETIMRHLGEISLFEDKALWVEYPHKSRLKSKGGEFSHIQTVGCLLMLDPEHPSHVAIFVAWKTDGGAIHHSYALLHWDLQEMAFSAASEDKTDAMERLAALCDISIPDGLMVEMEIWQGIKAANDPQLERLIKQTQQDAFGEHVFLLGVLLLLKTESIYFSETKEKIQDVKYLSVQISSAKPRFLLSNKKGFFTTLLGNRLVWRRPIVEK